MASTTTTSPSPRPGAAADAGGLLRAVQALAVLTLLSELFQFITAGQLFPRGGPEEVHAGGAIVLHVVSGLALVAVFLLRRRAGGALWPTVLAALVFVASFVQAATGGRDHLAVHVPGAMVLTLGSAVLAAWAFSGRAAGAAR